MVHGQIPINFSTAIPSKCEKPILTDEEETCGNNFRCFPGDYTIGYCKSNFSSTLRTSKDYINTHHYLEWTSQCAYLFTGYIGYTGRNVNPYTRGFWHCESCTFIDLEIYNFYCRAIPQSVEGPVDCYCQLSGSYISQHYILHVRFLTCNFVSYINRCRAWDCEAYYTGRFVYAYSGELNATYAESTNITYTCQDPGEDPYNTHCSEGTRFKYELYRNFYCDPSNA